MTRRQFGSGRRFRARDAGLTPANSGAQMNEEVRDSKLLSTVDESPGVVNEESVVTGTIEAVPAQQSHKSNQRISNSAIFAAGVVTTVALVAVGHLLSLHWGQVLEICLSSVLAGFAVTSCWKNRTRSLISLVLVGVVAVSRAFSAEAIAVPGNSVLVAFYWIIAILAGLTFLGRLAPGTEESEAKPTKAPGFLLLMLFVYGVTSQMQSEKRRQIATQARQTKWANRSQEGESAATSRYWNEVVLPYVQNLQAPKQEENIDEWLKKFLQSQKAASGLNHSKPDPQLTTEFSRLLRTSETILSCARRRRLQRNNQQPDASQEGTWLIDHHSVQALLDAPIEQIPGDLRFLRAAIIEQDESLLQLYHLHIRLSERYPGVRFPWTDNPNGETTGN